MEGGHTGKMGEGHTAGKDAMVEDHTVARDEMVGVHTAGMGEKEGVHTGKMGEDRTGKKDAMGEVRIGTKEAMVVHKTLRDRWKVASTRRRSVELKMRGKVRFSLFRR